LLQLDSNNIEIGILKYSLLSEYSSMNKIEEILTKIDITQLETKTYLALLELQQAQTGTLCKFTNIASSNIYKILDSLIKKGLVIYRVQNNIKIFMPAPPEALNELFLEKQKKLDEERKEIAELITNLKKIEIKKEPQSNYKYYEGFSAIKSMWHEVNSIMDSSSTVKIYTTREQGYERLIGFYTEHHKLREKKNVKEKLIFPLEGADLAKERIQQFKGITEIRLLNIKTDVEWGIVKDTFHLHYITGKVPRAFLIKDKKFAETFEEVFDKLWETAK